MSAGDGKDIKLSQNDNGSYSQVSGVMEMPEINDEKDLRIWNTDL